MQNGIRGIRRKAGVAGVAALTGLAGLLPLAAPASAYSGGTPTVSVINNITKAPDPLDLPQIALGDSSGTAKGWSLENAPGDAWEDNDVITFLVNDVDGDGVSFADTPTVTLNGEPVDEVSLTTTDGTTDDTLRIQLDLSEDTYGTLEVTGVTYNVDPAAAVGGVDVVVEVEGNDVTPSQGVSNAVLTNVITEYNDPEVGIERDTTSNVTLSPISISETDDEVLAADGAPGALCVALAGSINNKIPGANIVGFDNTASPSVEVTSGNATNPVITVVSPAAVQITFTGGNDASTFEISDLEIAGASIGNVGNQWFVVQNGVCGAGTTVSPIMTLTAVVDATRYGGSNRFATAATIADELNGTSDNAIIARADDFADALASSFLSSYLGRAPILLTNTNSIPSQTLNALRTQEVQNVYIVGGTAAVSQAVADQLDDTPRYPVDNTCGGGDELCTLTVFRIGGADRYQTAQFILDYTGWIGSDLGEIDLDPSNGYNSSDYLSTAFLARGDNFPDSLAAGPLSFNWDIPILLTPTGSLSSAARDAIVDHDIQQVIVLGGTSAVSDAVVAELEDLGVNVVRVGGANRQETAINLMQHAINPNEFGFDTDDLFLARGDTFPDALTVGPLAGDWAAPLLLTESPSSLGLFTTGALDATYSLFNWIYPVGGTAAISDSVVQAAINANVGTTLEP